MRRLYLAATAAFFFLMGLSLWKNNFSYPNATTQWKFVKSLIDVLIVIATAVYLPGLLVGWIVMWLTRTIRNNGIRFTFATILGLALSSVSGFLLDCLIILGVLAVDMFTGEKGVWGWYNQKIPDNFLPWMKEKDGSLERAS